MKQKLIWMLSGLCLLSLACSRGSSSDNSYLLGDPSQKRPLDLSEYQTKNSDVIVQLFNWTFEAIEREIPFLADKGYAQIHVSPPQLSIDSRAWWGRYQPVDYRVIDGPLGNEVQFKRMIDAAHRKGIKIIVDLVLNHTANPDSPLPAVAKELAAQDPLFTAGDYHQDPCISDYNSVDQVRSGRMCGGSGDKGLPDLNQSSNQVLKRQKDYLLKLMGLGADGFRIDAIKHMEPAYFARLFTPDIRKGRLVFGEIIADASAYDRDIKPYLESNEFAYYDFPLRDTVQKAFGIGGDLSVLGDSAALRNGKKELPLDRSITFVMNHDIPNNAGFRSMILESSDEALAYAYLLGRGEGIPYVYSDQGIDREAGLVDSRWAHYHRRPDVQSMVFFHNATSGESATLVSADVCHIAIQRGSRGLLAINKCGDAIDKFVKAPFPLGHELQDVLGASETIQIEGEYLHLVIPPRSAVMLLDLAPFKRQ